MIGEVNKVPAGYKGVIYGKSSQQELQGVEMHEKVTMEAIGSFEEFTTWQKDKWLDDKAYPLSLMSYLDCAKIIHS